MTLLRWHITRRIFWSTEAINPRYIGSPTHVVKRTIETNQLEMLIDGAWESVPTETTTIDETNGADHPPLSPELHAALSQLPRGKL